MHDIRIDGLNLPDHLDNLQNQALANNAPVSTVAVTVGGRISPSSSTAASAQALNITLMPNLASTATTFDISGVIYADLDRDGVQDPTDGAVPNAEVFLDVNQNGIFDPIVDPITITAEDGSYSFVGVEAAEGFYSVIVVEGTTGAVCHSDGSGDSRQRAASRVSSSRATALTNVNLGFAVRPSDVPAPPLRCAAISGFVFLDANNSGANEGEAGAAGRHRLHRCEQRQCLQRGRNVCHDRRDGHLHIRQFDAEWRPTASAL